MCVPYPYGDRVHPPSVAKVVSYTRMQKKKKKKREKKKNLVFLFVFFFFT